MNKKNSKKKAKVNNKKISRFGLILILSLALIILLINVITASYSWFNPDIFTGSQIKYEASYSLRSEKCTYETFLGHKVAKPNSNSGTVQVYGNIEYNTSPSTGSVTCDANSYTYFRTNITNADEKYASNVSLFISSFPGNSSGVGLGVSFPSSSYHIYTQNQTEVYIIRNAYVVQNDDENSGVLSVEWFVKNMSSSNVTVNLNDLYLMYS